MSVYVFYYYEYKKYYATCAVRTSVCNEDIIQGVILIESNLRKEE